jgi:rhodanese-related sulfurtransferase
MNLRATLLPLAFLFAASLGCSAEARKVAPKEAAQLVAEGKAVIVDVREAPEWKDSGVAAPAALLPKSDFDGPQKLWKPFLEKNAGKEIIVYCRSGGRSEEVAAKLAAKGVKAGNIGTLRAWTSAGLPTRAADAPPATK